MSLALQFLILAALIFIAYQSRLQCRLKSVELEEQRAARQREWDADFLRATCPHIYSHYRDQLLDSIARFRSAMQHVGVRLVLEDTHWHTVHTILRDRYSTGLGVSPAGIAFLDKLTDLSCRFRDDAKSRTVLTDAEIDLLLFLRWDWARWLIADYVEPAKFEPVALHIWENNFERYLSEYAKST